MRTLNRFALYGGVLAALIIVFVVGLLTGSRRGDDLGYVFSEVATSSVVRVEIESSDRRVKLRRSGDGWVLDEETRQYPARGDRITAFLDEASQSRYVRRITGNEDLWSDFGLAEGFATVSLFVESNDSVVAVSPVIWGDASAEPGLAYVRSPGASDVYATDGQLGFYLDQPASYWSYLRLLPESVSPGDVIAYAADGTRTGDEGEALQVSHVWTLEEETWRDALGNELGAAEVERVVRDATEMVGRDFARDTPDDGIPVGTVVLDTADGRQFRLEFTRFDEEYVVTPDGPDVPGDAYGGLSYRIAESTFERLLPEPEDVD